MDCGRYIYPYFDTYFHIYPFITIADDEIHTSNTKTEKSNPLEIFGLHSVTIRVCYTFFKTPNLKLHFKFSCVSNCLILQKKSDIQLQNNTKKLLLAYRI